MKILPIAQARISQLKRTRPGQTAPQSRNPLAPLAIDKVTFSGRHGRDPRIAAFEQTLGFFETALSPEALQGAAIERDPKMPIQYKITLANGSAFDFTAQRVPLEETYFDIRPSGPHETTHMTYKRLDYPESVFGDDDDGEDGEPFAGIEAVEEDVEGLYEIDYDTLDDSAQSALPGAFDEGDDIDDEEDIPEITISGEHKGSEFLISNSGEVEEDLLGRRQPEIPQLELDLIQQQAQNLFWRVRQHVFQAVGYPEGFKDEDPNYTGPSEFGNADPVEEADNQQGQKGSDSGLDDFWEAFVKKLK